MLWGIELNNILKICTFSHTRGMVPNCFNSVAFSDIRIVQLGASPKFGLSKDHRTGRCKKKNCIIMILAMNFLGFHILCSLKGW